MTSSNPGRADDRMPLPGSHTWRQHRSRIRRLIIRKRLPTQRNPRGISLYNNYKYLILL
ncbi:hypothetical protein [Methylorubrum populi]|uniref:hypothetical protein n=1 Tax=Methylorubrum populi TaxID=223967 RepID=UPI003F65EB2C